MLAAFFISVIYFGSGLLLHFQHWQPGCKNRRRELASASRTDLRSFSGSTRFLHSYRSSCFILIVACLADRFESQTHSDRFAVHTDVMCLHLAMLVYSGHVQNLADPDAVHF